jgi:hypothetical protein
VRLGPVRGVLYAVTLIVAVPLAWQAGEQKAALFIGAVALFGIGVEAMSTVRKWGP